jgi:hypothetical protein
VVIAATWVADNILICAEEILAISALVTVEKSYVLIFVAVVDEDVKSIAMSKLQPPLEIKVKCSLIDTMEKYFSGIF